MKNYKAAEDLSLHQSNPNNNNKNKKVLMLLIMLKCKSSPDLFHMWPTNKALAEN